MAQVLFFVAAIGAIAGAIGVIALSNPFYSVLSLVSHLIALAMLFLLLSAEFVAAAQVVVYAGAVMVLYVFVVSYVGGKDMGLTRSAGRGLTLGAFAFGGALALELMIAVLGSGLKGLDGRGGAHQAGFGSAGQIGDLLLTRFLAPFEIASYLLLVAAVGAVVLARRRGGIEPDDPLAARTLSAMELFGPRPLNTGTMAEGAGRLDAEAEADADLDAEAGAARQEQRA